MISHTITNTTTINTTNQIRAFIALFAVNDIPSLLTQSSISIYVTIGSLFSRTINAQLLDIMPSYVGKTNDKDDWNIVQNDYNIKDFLITNEKNDIIATVCYTCLKPGKSTRGHADEHGEFYAFMSGQGVMVTEKVLHKVDADEGHSHGRDYDITPTVFVKKGEFHRVLNMSEYKNLNFLSVVPGIVKREPHL